MSTRTSALDALIFGVDVQSGDVRGDSPAYALIAWDGTTAERDVVSRRKLLRRIASDTPAIVATDNVYELAADKDALIRLLAELPHETAIVQVTGAERPEPLSRVAQRHGVPYAKDPMAEAEASARLAAHNVGYRVSAFTDRTTVKVARGRSTGKGGWSEDRYTRRIHGAVRRRAREIADSLESAGLEFEREVREAYGGLANAVFSVEARPSVIPVSASRNGDVRVEIERVRRDGIEFEPLARRRDRVVVGVDPGTTTAVAIVGLDGAVLDVWSSRTSDGADVVEWIVERGRPVIVAADVTPMPDTVEQIRRSFDAAGWTPSSDLPVDEKLHRTRSVAYEDDHQRDALAAALFAHDEHADQFERIRRRVPAGRDTDAIIERVVAGGESVEAALAADEDGQDETGSSRDRSGPDREATRRIGRLEGELERLEAYVDTLEERLADREERIDELEEALEAERKEDRRAVRTDRTVTRLERRIKALERERDEAHETVEELEGKVERMKALWKLDHSNFSDVAEKQEGLVPVKVVEKFTPASIRAADEAYGLAPDDVWFIRDASGAGREAATLVADLEPRILLRSTGLSDVSDAVLFDREVPVGEVEAVAMQEVDELAVAREADVEAEIDRWRERARERERIRKEAMVDRVISEHRADEV